MMEFKWTLALYFGVDLHTNFPAVYITNYFEQPKQCVALLAKIQSPMVNVTNTNMVGT